MFETFLRALLAPAPARLPQADANLALAALMVRAARTDGLYAAEEVERIDRVLMARMDNDAFAAAKLRAEAEELETEAPDTVRFTRALKDATELDERLGMMQALWSVALVDGLRDAEEDRLMRLVANLLGLSDVENAQSRQAAWQGLQQE
ncbi:TerB family tellurite resistance protein [Xinfangfangia sp. CPCC 101601]|uniref:TerB family tellurite resistance protein n=1 Tax=Pseudogemmobacter lacusdianii TaxID=3069608 RepID=A0ABU0VVI4_9RHOB|nr:TerB family tellurite resistance protein [Xinfangfangia sp. CPCC 101601]MDQ2065749.1 TerB family tellurite resistance protein [Xinfangfangia sp. CPCC 101601]